MNPFIDLRFPLHGSAIDADHAYYLYGAVSTLCPAIHREQEARTSSGKQAHEPALVGIHPVSGQFIGGRRLKLLRSSALTVRLPSDQVGQFLALAGKTLRIGTDSITTGVPQIELLQPAPSLRCRILCIKGAVTPELMLEKALRDIIALGIASPDLKVGMPFPQNPSPRDSGKGRKMVLEANGGNPESHTAQPVRRTLRINGKEIIGFPLQVSGLSASESILLQERGIGGRRHFGCGLFVAANSAGLNRP